MKSGPLCSKNGHSSALVCGLEQLFGGFVVSKQGNGWEARSAAVRTSKAQAVVGYVGFEANQDAFLYE